MVFSFEIYWRFSFFTDGKDDQFYSIFVAKIYQKNTFACDLISIEGEPRKFRFFENP